MQRRSAILAVFATTLLLMGVSAGQALAAGDDDIPGVPVGAGTLSGVVDATTDVYDVYSVMLFDGEAVTFTLNYDVTGKRATVALVPPATKTVHTSYSVLGRIGYYGSLVSRTFTYTPAKDAVYHIIVKANYTGAPYQFTISGSAQKPPTQSYLRLRTSATKVKKGRSVRLSAKLVDVSSALIPGYSAKLYRSYNGRSWKKIASLASTTGAYSKKVRVTRKAWFKMRYTGNSTWSSCTSRVVKVAVR